MKILKRRIDRDGKGEIKLLPQEDEDQYHAFNLIAHGDHLTSGTFRKVIKTSSTGSTKTDRVRFTVRIAVDSVQFDSQTCTIRVKGTNIRESKHIKMGASHTVELAVMRDFTLYKECWDSVFLERLAMACDVSNRAEVAAVVMEPGLAHLCLITAHMTVVRAKIEVNIPRKRRGSSARHDKGVRRFYDAVAEAIRRHVRFEIVKCVVLASPAFVKEDFLSYLMEQAARHEWRDITHARPKFLLTHAASGHKHALKEALQQPEVAAQVAETKAFEEVAALQRFLELLNSDPDRAYYGYHHCVHACEANAIDILLVTDSLFRGADVATRKKYIRLVDAVKDQGGRVLVFSTQHVSGEQLEQMTGVAALLRFPIPEVDDIVPTGSAAGAADGEAELAESDTDSDGDYLDPNESVPVPEFVSDGDGDGVEDGADGEEEEP